MMMAMGIGHFVLMVVLWLAALGGGVWLLAKLFPVHPADQVHQAEQREKDPLKILQQRYARGEITRQEFEAIRRDLEA